MVEATKYDWRRDPYVVACAWIVIVCVIILGIYIYNGGCVFEVTPIGDNLLPEHNKTFCFSYPWDAKDFIMELNSFYNEPVNEFVLLNPINYS